jgi:membrane-bound lytic murein transglycosylase D
MKFLYLAILFCLFFSFQLIAQESEVAYWSPPDFGLKNSKAIGYETNTFKPPGALENDVQFWVDIYSKYTTHQGVFHLVGATDQILGEIDLTDVYSNQKWSAIRREKEAELIIRIQKRLIAKKLKIANVKMIRLQMGLKDRMREAIKLSGLYLPQIEKIFAEQKLPMELTRLAFVESSFNILAGSKVGASGLWQIMPNVARKFNYITPTYDKRNHPYYSTLVAAKILKENHQILKSWPLAVTAYNHGVGSLKKIVKKYQSNDIGYLVENVKAKKSFGFASRNFYATFLAALYVEKNANLYFAEPIEKYSELKLKDFTLKKKLKYDDFIQLFGHDKKKMKFANSHIYSKFLKPGRFIPEKTLICLPSDSSGRLAEVLESE